MEKFTMVAPCEWALENVEKNVEKTLASKMILFRGERVFRVGLKNCAKPTLFFMAVNLNKIGMKVKEVTYWYEDAASSSQSKSSSERNMAERNGDGSFQLFTRDLLNMVNGNGIFFFRIYIDGIVSQYSYQLSDRLLKSQLWAAVKNQQHGADVELLVKGTTFSVHKAILAARSPVFAAEFKKEKSGDVPYQLRIDNVDPKAVEQFLYFLYTGESMTPNLANKELLKLAEIYKLTTLENLCRISLKEVNIQKMEYIMAALKTKNATSCPLEIKQEKDTEIVFDQHISTVDYQWNLLTHMVKRLFASFTHTRWPRVVFRYKNEEVFFKQSAIEIIAGKDSASIQFISANHLNFGFKVAEVTFKCDDYWDYWEEMNQRDSQQTARLSLFTSTRHLQVNNITPWNMCFRTKVVSTIESNSFEMVDTAWTKQLWLAAMQHQLTDVDITVGEMKLEAHRVILSAQSPVFCAMLGKISNTGKSTITIGAEFELANVEHFLKFFYTGSLDVLANKQLFELAELYEVEKLKKICRANIHEPDVEDLINSFLVL